MTKRYEYRVEYLKLTTGKGTLEQIVEALNRFGAEGWRFNRMYGEAGLRSLTSWKGGVNLLQERETAA